MLIHTVPIFKSRHPDRSCSSLTLSVAWPFSEGAEVLLQEYPGAAGEHRQDFISGGC